MLLSFERITLHVILILILYYRLLYTSLEQKLISSLAIQLSIIHSLFSTKLEFIRKKTILINIKCGIFLNILDFAI